MYRMAVVVPDPLASTTVLYVVGPAGCLLSCSIHSQLYIHTAVVTVAKDGRTDDVARRTRWTP